MKAGILTDITDHLPIFVTISWNEALHESQESFYRTKISDLGTQNFSANFHAIDFDDFYDEPNINVKYDIFLQSFMKLYNECFPLKKVYVKRSSCIRPWLTNDLRKRCKKKNRLYKKFILNPSPSRESNHKHFRNSLNNDIRHAKQVSLSHYGFCAKRLTVKSIKQEHLYKKFHTIKK